MVAVAIATRPVQYIQILHTDVRPEGYLRKGKTQFLVPSNFDSRATYTKISPFFLYYTGRA